MIDSAKQHAEKHAEKEKALRKLIRKWLMAQDTQEKAQALLATHPGIRKTGKSGKGS